MKKLPSGHYVTINWLRNSWTLLRTRTSSSNLEWECTSTCNFSEECLGCSSSWLSPKASPSISTGWAVVWTPMPLHTLHISSRPQTEITLKTKWPSMMDTLLRFCQQSAMQLCCSFISFGKLTTLGPWIKLKRTTQMWDLKNFVYKLRDQRKVISMRKSLKPSFLLLDQFTRSLSSEDTKINWSTLRNLTNLKKKSKRSNLSWFWAEETRRIWDTWRKRRKN